MRMLFLAALALSLSGCGLGRFIQAGDGAGPGYKTVSAKEEPMTLVAVDGTRCTAKSSDYQRIKVGDRAWCLWRDGGGMRPGGGGLPVAGVPGR